VDVKVLLSPDRARELTLPQPEIASTIGPGDAPANRRFEGLYGRFYSRVIQTPALRKVAFSLWGSADPLYDLEAFVADAVRAARSSSPSPVLVDLPSGSGTLLPFLARERFEGTVVEVDLAISMLRRAVALQRSSASRLETVFLQSDALDLPFRSAVADVVVSINGLHVLPDPERFLVEVARITKRRGKLWLITPVDGSGVRSRAILAAANTLRITPKTPPSLEELRALLRGVGFEEIRSYGGMSITGLACERVPAD
jgi:ubiquinone/menaquinone biosynthesis C-methylase UbiE